MLSQQPSGQKLAGLIAGVALGFIALCLAISDRSPVLSQIEAEFHEFNLFRENYQKEYLGSESLMRFQKFKDNLAYIRKINSEQSTVVLGVTEFADMDFAEFSSLYLFPEEPAPLKSSDKFMESQNFNLNDEVNALPATVNWLSQNKVTPVKNQGKCGSCYTFASTGAIESAWAIHQNLSESLPTFSEQQLMDCSANSGCEGGYAWLCFKYVVSNGGLNSDSNYTYKGVDETCNKTQEENHDVSITSYQNVTAYNYLSLMHAVVAQPVATSVEANMQWQLYKSGIITNNCGIALNHAVLITGYDTTSVPYWVIKNSWGAAWGMAGYVNVGLGSGYGVCGINTRPVYPIV